MPEELFKDNFFILYLLFVISVIAIDRLSERQKVSIIYFCSYGMTFGSSLSNSYNVFLLVLMLFLIQEYFTSDRRKLAIFRRIHYKIADFLYMSVFQYKLWLVLLAFLFKGENFSNYFEAEHWLCTCSTLFSLLLFVLAIIWMYNVPEEFHMISHIYNVIQEHGYAWFKPNDVVINKLRLITDREDRLYWRRKNSYTIVSYEYIKEWYLDRKGSNEPETDEKTDISGLSEFIHMISSVRKHTKRFWRRGHSTIPMQLTRILSYKHGLVFANSNVKFKNYRLIKRKIYEIFYTRMIFEGLKEYLRIELNRDMELFSAYLVYLYPYIVQTKVDGVVYRPASKLFKKGKEILPMEEWDYNLIYSMCEGFNK